MRIPMISLMAAGALALGGCADMYGYNGLGVGVGYGGGYGGYGGGYGSYGYGSPYGGYYGSSYGYPSYGYGATVGYGYGSPYYGWYDNYYYPGTGYYVYDNYRRPHSMTHDRRTAYWSKRSRLTMTTRSTTTHIARQAELERASKRAIAQSRRDDRQDRTRSAPPAPAIDKGPLNSPPAGGGSARSR